MSFDSEAKPGYWHERSGVNRTRSVEYLGMIKRRLVVRGECLRVCEMDPDFPELQL